MATTVHILDRPQHFVMTGVSWEYYEQTLKEIGDRPIRVAYLDGMMELLSPLPEHGRGAFAIGDLVSHLTLECDIPRISFGVTTFRRKAKAAGAEPDACFYFNEVDSVQDMKRFNPRVHRAPDLWIEVDVISASVPREPIYARLGVPEVWHWRRGRLTVRLLTDKATYVTSKTSRAFPFVPMATFATFISKMIEGNQTR